MILFPLAFIAQFYTEEHSDDFEQQVRAYSYQYGPVLFLIIAAMCYSIYQLSQAISKVFSSADLREKQILRQTMYLFIISGLLRLLDIIVTHVAKGKILELYLHPAHYNFIVISVWIVCDYVPTVFLFKVHY